jgi:AbrB family looped-hinge helix DNA binding protein
MRDTFTVVVSSKGRVVIPASLRKKLGIKAGTRLAIRSDENELILQPINDAFIRRLRGSCKGKDSIAAAREREHKREDRIRGQKLAAIVR